ncbi:helix-turn-helix transcriptional regulator [Streptomyces sp. NPDC048281]|uniref:response regulator transcription factor n=1 Tax=Streptomyces sp. NPDC048281 TaxID=3154715 RepID=UPI0034137A28
MTLTAKTLGDALSPREQGIVQLASRGYTDGEIAAELEISIHTVTEYWRYRIRPSLGADNRTHAVALAVAQGLAFPQVTV